MSQDWEPRLLTLLKEIFALLEDEDTKIYWFAWKDRRKMSLCSGMYTVFRLHCE